MEKTEDMGTYLVFRRPDGRYYSANNPHGVKSVRNASPNFTRMGQMDALTIVEPGIIDQKCRPVRIVWRADEVFNG